MGVLDGKVAIVTGAGRLRGIGRATGMALAAQGAKVVGSFLLCKAIIPTLLQQNQGGRIINLSSVMGKRGVAHTTAYCAANFAIQGFTQALAQELAPYRISVNAICPGTIDTARMDVLGREELWQSIVESIPMKRAASDEEVAGLIAYLCSPSAEYITGQSINIDGGVVMW